MKAKLEALDLEYKGYHYAVIDLIDDEDELGDEQDALDEHDDNIANLAIHVYKLIDACSSHSSGPTNPRTVQQRKLQHLEKGLLSVHDAITALAGEAGDICRLQQHQEQLSDFKHDLAGIRDSVLAMGLDDGDNFITLMSTLRDGIFDCSLMVKESLRSLAHSSTTLTARV